MRSGLHKRLRHAFTLIELLVVVAIIGILATVILANIRRSIWKAKEAATFQGLNAVRTAIDMYTALASVEGGSGAGYPDWILWDGFGNPGDHWFNPEENSAVVMHPDMAPYLAVMPYSRVRYNGFTAYSGSQPNGESSGIYYGVTAGEYQNGNNRGWFYYKPGTTSDSYTAKDRFVINNDGLSTEGKRYDTY